MQAGSSQPGFEEIHETPVDANRGEEQLLDHRDANDAHLQVFEGESTSGTALMRGREPWAARLAGRMGRHHAALMLVSTLVLSLIVALPALRGSLVLEVGKPAPHDVVAPVTAIVPDGEATAQRRRDAAALVPPVYEGAPHAQQQALSRLHTLIEARKPAQPQLNWGKIQNAAGDATRAVYRRAQIRSDVASDIAAAQTHIAKELPAASRRWKLNAEEIAVAGELARSSARFANLIANERATQQARRDAQNSAHAAFERVQSGEVLVHAGEIVTAQKWAQLQELNLVAPPLPGQNGSTAFWQRATAHAGLCALLVLLAAGYLSVLDRPLLKKPASLWLAAMTPLLFLLAFRFMLRVPHADVLLIPLVATAAIMLTILLEARIGVLMGVVIAAPGVLLARGDAALFLSAVLAAWIGALAVANITSRKQVAYAALLLMAANAMLSLTFGILRETPFEQNLSLMMWSALAGIFAVIAGSGLAMVLERPFGITTHLHLLELLAPDEVVLRRLQTEAPGTYTHSLMVSLLAEAAAKSVEADALLCRVGGLYHDIGKLHRPHCFVENQSGENIHDRLSPQLSSRIIVAHVRDGLALGRALKLPQPILDAIATHHGTSRVEYFYKRALEANDLLDPRLAVVVNEEEFRYPGPRPRTRENAIIMLADTVEASSRALPDPTPEKLAHHVEAMIGLKLREGELSECDLTLRDLQKVQSSFLHVLRGALHQRIAYPSAEKIGADEAARALPAKVERKTRRSVPKLSLAKEPVLKPDDAKATAATVTTPKAAATRAADRVQHALAENFLGRKATGKNTEVATSGKHSSVIETSVHTDSPHGTQIATGEAKSEASLSRNADTKAVTSSQNGKHSVQIEMKEYSSSEYPVTNGNLVPNKR